MKRKTNFGRDAYAPPELYVVVLAAGMGTRLKPHTDAVPKALLRLDDGEPLLSRTLAGLTTRPEVAEVIVVGGHRYDVLRSYLSTLDAPPPCRTVFNPDFAVKGPIESLRRSLKLVPRGGTVAILNGDTWYGRAALGSLVERAMGAQTFAVLFGSHIRELALDDVCVIEAGGSVMRIGKEITEARAISAGCCLLFPRAVSALQRLIDKGVKETLTERATWHQAINLLVETGHEIEFRALPRAEWFEVDEEADLLALLDRLCA